MRSRYFNELGGKPPEPGQLWGVWAAEAPDAMLTATDTDGAFTLNGTKVWCAGAGFLHPRAGDRPARRRNARACSR